jgi:hypothetical protein
VKRNLYITLSVAAGLMMSSSCDSRKDPVTSGREAVREVVSQPLNALEGVKHSLKQSEDKTKTAAEELDKETKH